MPEACPLLSHHLTPRALREAELHGVAGPRTAHDLGSAPYVDRRGDTGGDTDPGIRRRRLSGRRRRARHRSLGVRQEAQSAVAPGVLLDAARVLPPPAPAQCGTGGVSRRAGARAPGPGSCARTGPGPGPQRPGTGGAGATRWPPPLRGPGRARMSTSLRGREGLLRGPVGTTAPRRRSSGRGRPGRLPVAGSREPTWLRPWPRSVSADRSRLHPPASSWATVRRPVRRLAMTTHDTATAVRATAVATAARRWGADDGALPARQRGCAALSSGAAIRSRACRGLPGRAWSGRLPLAQGKVQDPGRSNTPSHHPP